MKFLLYAIVPFLNEWLNDQSSETSIDQSIQIYFKTDHIVPEIIDVVNFHLKNIKKVPNWKEEFEEKLKQIETIDNRETYTHQVDNMVWNIPRDHNPSTTFFLIAATILNIHPGRQYSASLNQPLEEAKRMTDLHMNPPVTCFKAGELAEHLEKPTFNNSGFIMSSFECLQNKKKDIKSLLSCKKIASIVVDEADRLHNMNSRDNQCIKELLENSKKGETLLQLISGTPFQNSFKEIYTLVSLANPPDLFPSITQEKLISSLKHCINRITSKKDIDQKNLSQIVSKTFLDFNKIADLMRKVIIRVSITDKHVIEDWNYQIPSFEIESIFVDLKDEIKNRIQSIKNEKRNFLQQFSQIKQILIHPTLKNLDRKSSEAKSIIKNLELASNEELTQQIENSPLLKGLINSRPIKDCISNNDRTIIFVQNLIEADIIKTVIDKFYQTNQPIVTIYEGSLKIKERNQIIKNFKTEKDGTKPRFLILMTECGGTGLNLQEAARCIIASRSFNPSKDDQARARCIRVNNIGHKIIYEIDYNDSSSVHLRMIRQEKRDWVKFLFTSETDTVEDNFQHWKKLLKTICERKFIKNGVSEKDLRYQLFLKRMEELLFDPADQCEVEVVSNEPLMQDLGSETDISMEDCLEMTTTF